MNTQQMLYQLETVRRSILTIQKLQSRACQTQALLQTVGYAANLYSWIDAINHFRYPVRSCPRR
ncbi:MAG: hypothetical protein KH615_08455, partial [Clostridiales bacterium]|nr:hypothetical protein [Clostridiales bacterium]